jgi:hypothetical protein
MNENNSTARTSLFGRTKPRSTRTNSSGRFSKILIGTVAMCIGALGVANAQTAGQSSEGKKDGLPNVSFTGRTAEPTRTFTPTCVGTRCLVTFNTFDFIDGDLSGSNSGAGSLTLTSPTAGYGSQTSLFVGTVKGCNGGGTAILLWTVKIDLTSRNRGTWEVAPGSGTGGLSGLAGSGIYDAQPRDPAAVSQLTGSMGCVDPSKK